MFELTENQRGISSVIGGFLIHLTLGTFYTLGNINTYMTSYLVKYVDPTVTYANSIWINASFMLGQGCLMTVGGLMEKKYGARWTCLLGSAIFSGSIALTSISIKRGFLPVVLTYGFISSLGVGLAYVAPLAAGMRWFPKRKGFVNGITVAGYGLGALIFNQVQTAYLNPENLTPDPSGFFVDESILERVPSVFTVLGIVYFIIQAIACCLIFRPPQSTDEIMFSEGRLLIKSPSDPIFEAPATEGYSSCDEEDKSSLEDISEKYTHPANDLTVSEAARTKEFMLMWLMFAFSCQGVQYVNTQFKAFGQTFVHDDHFLALTGSLASIANAGGRIAWGRFLDRTSFRTCFILLNCMFASFVLTFYVPRGLNSNLLYFVWVLSIFFSFSSIWVIFPTTVALVFGKSHAGPIYGLLFTAPALTGLAGALLFQYIQGHFGWLSSFISVACLNLIALIFLCWFPDDEKLSAKSSSKRT